MLKMYKHPIIYIMEVQIAMLNHIEAEKIIANRLVLRRYEITDADDMFQNWVTDKKVTRFWGGRARLFWH